MTDLQQYGLALSAAFVLAILSGRREIVMSACVVIASWAAWCLYILATGDYEPWKWGIFVDTLAVAALLKLPSCKVRVVISALFAAQVMTHIAYGAVLLWKGSADSVAYMTNLDVTGWAQLAIVGGWGGGVIGRRFVHRWRRRYLLRYSANVGRVGTSQ